MNTEIVIHFKQWDCRIEFAKYALNENTAIRLIDIHQEWDNLIAVATVNLPDLKQGEVAIKDYSENEGMYETLLAAEIIKPAHRYLSSGFIDSILVCYLNNVQNVNS